jgi:hypothetical protein
MFLIGYWIGRFLEVPWWVYLIFFLGVVGGHLFWGGKYKPKEQEWPPYIEE